MSRRKELPGFDAVVDGKFVGNNLNERKIIDLLGTYKKCKLVMRFIGAEGSAGPREFATYSQRHLAGLQIIILLQSPAKPAHTTSLCRFDTGDAPLDHDWLV